ncbi:hypothetical protein Tco_1370936 [Tanacetum coccineum]
MFLAPTVSSLMAYFVAILTPNSARSCVMQSTLPTKGMRSIISTVSISLEDFMSSILLRMVIIVAVVIVTVIWVVIFVNVIVGVVIVVAIIGVVVFVTIIGIVVVVGGVPSIIKLSFVIIGSCTEITLYYLVPLCPESYVGGFFQSSEGFGSIMFPQCFAAVPR